MLYYSLANYSPYLVKNPKILYYICKNSKKIYINKKYLYLLIKKHKNLLQKIKEAAQMKIKTYLIQVNIAKLKSEVYSIHYKDQKGRRFL